MERTEQKLEQWSYLFVICEICSNQANSSNESCIKSRRLQKKHKISQHFELSDMKCCFLWISNRRVTNPMTSSRLCIAQLNANTNLIVNCVLKHLKDIKHILRECLNDNMSCWECHSVSDGIILWPYHHISNIISRSGPGTRPIVSFN